MSAVVNRVGHRAEEAPFGVRREVDDDVRAGHEAADRLDVAGDLAVERLRRAARGVPRSLDRHGGESRPRQLQRLEVDVEVFRAIAAAERDDSDGHATTVDLRRKAVEPRDLGRGEGRPRALALLRRGGSRFRQAAASGERLLVEAEDADDGTPERARQVNRADVAHPGRAPRRTRTSSVPKSRASFEAAPRTSTDRRVGCESTISSPSRFAHRSTRSAAARFAKRRS